MKGKARGNPETRFDRFAFWLGSAIAAWLISMLLTQVFYWLVPAKPTPVVQRLEEEAAQRPFLTENGFRLAGLLAPAGADPVAFGRCLYPDAEVLARMPIPDSHYSPQSREEDEARRAECLRDQTALALPPAIADAKAGPHWELKDWIALGEQAPTPVLLERAHSIWTAGPRGLGADLWSPTPDRRALSKLAQWRVAHAVQLWHIGSRSAALETWASSGNDALLGADGLFYEAMLAASELSLVLLGMQTAIHSSDRLSDREAIDMLRIVGMTDQMLEITRRAMLSEWHMGARSYRSLYQGVLPALPQNESVDGAMIRTAIVSLRDLSLDPVDTVNQFTLDFDQQRSRLVQLASGQAIVKLPANAPCAWMGDWNVLCRAYQRNPVGRVLTSVAMADYTSSSNRITDLRNLAASTRLTIEARRQGLKGEALTRFVAEAPDNMRDIYSHKAFAYDPSQRRLTIQLREKGTVLGEDSYALPL